MTGTLINETVVWFDQAYTIKDFDRMAEEAYTRYKKAVKQREE